MFKKTVCGLILAWIGSVAYCLYVFQSVMPVDREHYQQLVRLSSGSEQVEIYQTQQKRFNVSKHFILSKGKERLHMHLHSDSSEIFLNQEKGKMEVVECFKTLTCATQEGLMTILPDGREERYQFEDLLSHPYLTDPLIKKRQIVRQFEAERATYHYKTEELNAEEVKFSRYLAAGNQLEKNPLILSLLMSGTAKKMQLSLANEHKPFKAQHLNLSH